MPERKPKPIPSEQTALLAAIVAQPDDDTARLVYADWLQENDDTEQAEFIRASIALARAPRGSESGPLARRLRELAYAQGDNWMEALGIACTTDRFERGFPLRITFDGASEFLEMAEAVFARLPIRGLRISAFGDSDDLGDDGVEQLAGFPALSRLTLLQLIDHPRVSSDSWEVLFRSPHLPRLKYLSLHGCGIGFAETQALASAPVLAQLTDLDLSHNSIGNDGALAIFASPHLTKLERLWLEDNFHISDEAREVLAQRLGDGLFLHSSPNHDEVDQI